MCLSAGTRSISACGMPVLQHQQGVALWAPQALFSPQSGHWCSSIGGMAGGGWCRLADKAWYDTAMITTTCRLCV